ncbi:T9SS type A sorting domain-containing protein [Adhaeribacter soli]|nr:T9SS type A sorting domain-containing protein [Adhaeribacter soli]
MLWLLGFGYQVKAQTTLATGDISIVGWNSNTTDQIAFVPWVSLAPNTVIRFTDNGWNSGASATQAGNSRNLEQVAMWVNTSGSTIAAGTVIIIEPVYLNGGYYASMGTVSVFNNGGGTTSSMALTNIGDQLTAYQTANPADQTLSSTGFSPTNTSPATFSGTVLYALSWPNGWLTSGSSGSQTSYLPSDLTSYNIAFTGGSAAVQGGRYSGSTSGLSISQYKAAVNNPANWTVSNTSVALNSSSVPDFQTAPPAPAITGHPGNRTRCAGGNATFSVTATNATSYQWQVNTGSGFTNVANAGVYSGATSSTLTITAVTGAMNGYQYRVVVSGATAPAATSNTATLTVSNIVVSSAYVNVSCNGGSNGAAAVSVSGGITPYTYSWSPRGGTSSTATGLSAGTYTVTITDDIGCTATRTFNITQPAAPVSGTTVVTNVSCNGGNTGAINLTPTGGTSPYTYNWGGGITTEDRSNLTAGTYTVTITDANSCTGTITATVNQPASPVSGVGVVTNVSCNGGSNGTIDLTPSGGTAPYTYYWAGGITTQDRTGLTAGNYSVVITDVNGCTSTQSYFVNQPSGITATTTATDATCSSAANGSATVTASGGTSPYTYSWAPSGGTGATASNLAPGTYTVTVIDANNCTKQATATVTAPAAPGNPAVFGNGTWNVYAWNAGGGANTGASWSQNYAGFYTDTTLNMNTVPIWNTLTSPSDAPGYQGCVVAADNHSWSAKRTGFTCGYYIISIPAHDDHAELLINGSMVWQHIGCCDSHTNVWQGYLSPTSQVEFRVTEGGGNSYGEITFARVKPTISGLTTICGGSPVNLAATPATGSTYLWSTGATTQSINVTTPGTYSVTISGAGCSSTVSTTVTEVVATAAGATICAGDTATLTASGADVYNWYNAASGGTLLKTGASFTTPVLTNTTTYYLQGVKTQTKSLSTINTGGNNQNGVMFQVAAHKSLTINGFTITPTSVGSTIPLRFYYKTGTYSGFQNNASAWTLHATTSVVNAGSQIFVPVPELALQQGQQYAFYITTTDGTNISYTNGDNTFTDGNLTITTGTGNMYPFSTVYSPRTWNGSLSYMLPTCEGPRKPVTVTVNPAATLTINAANVTCHGAANGTATVSASGGTAPYTYLWSNGATTATISNLAPGTYTVTSTDAKGCRSTNTVTITEPASVLAANVTGTNATCNGSATGTASVSANGGTAPYSYSWSPAGGTAATASGLTAGTYTVTITDARGCTITRSLTIGQPAAIAGSTVVTNVSCFGGSNGSINLTPSGGSGPYTFNWGGGVTTEDRTGLLAGNYSVTITDANGCTGTVTATVGQPASPVSGTTVITNVACNGGNTGAINLTPTGGTGSYTFLWNDGRTTEDRTGLVAGTYSVTITDANSCTSTVTTTVGQPASPVSGTTVVTNVACNGGTNGAINLTPNGGTAPYTFNWGNGITTEDRTGLAAGTYTVVITDLNGCTASISAAVGQPATAIGGSTVVSHVSCFGGSNGTIDLTPSGGTAPYTYNWSGGITTQDRTGLSAGTYTVVITDANGCTGTVTASVNQPSAPVSGTTVVTNVSSFGGSNGAINLTPSGGTAPYTYNWGGGITTQDRTGLIAGTYTVTITDDNGCTGTVMATVTQPAPSSNANLANLTLSSGTLNPVFAANTTSYTASVNSSTTSVVLTATIADPAATLKINNTAATSGSGRSITLASGSNLITVEVTAQNGSIKTYTVNVTQMTPTGPISWTGTTSTDWNTASNWSSNSVPASTSDVVIPSGVSRYPVISSGTSLAKDLTIASGASLTVNGGTLEVKEDFTNNGSFTATGGSAIFSGSVVQVIGGANPSAFHDLTISAAGASLAGPVSVQRVLTLNGNLNTNGNTFTLLSNASGTAMVVNAGGVVNGTAKVQRYINPALNAAAGYRHFASPVTATTVSDFATAGFTPVVNPAYNTAAKPGTVRPFPTVFQYNQSRLTNDSAATMDFGFGWESPAALSSALTPGKGYSVNIPASQTVDFTGTLSNGTVTVTGLGRGATTESGWHLLGNPYPAPIDWDNITIPSGMMDAVYAFRSSSAYNGSYAAYVNGVGSLTGGVIPAMQAFFVRTTAAVSSFSFSNAARLTTYQNPSFYRSTETRPLLQLSASKGQQQDEAYLYLEQGATTGMDNSFDAYSLPMGAVRVYTLAGASQLSINGLGYSAAPQQIPLVVEGAAGTYQLKVEQLLNQFQVQLEDKQLNTMQTLTPTSVVSFSHAGGSTATRFVLHVGARVSGVADATKGMEVKLYPNPSQGKFQLQLSGLKASSAEMTITDIAGKVVMQKQVKASNGTISEAVELKAAKGIYLLQIKADQQVITRKVVVE